MKCSKCGDRIEWQHYRLVGWKPCDPSGGIHRCGGNLPGVVSECPKCHDQGFIPAGPFAPLTGFDCTTCRVQDAVPKYNPL